MGKEPKIVARESPGVVAVGRRKGLPRSQQPNRNRKPLFIIIFKKIIMNSEVGNGFSGF